jgi:hypothetical protein
LRTGEDARAFIIFDMRLRLRRCDGSFGSGIHQILQFLAGLEERDLFRGDFDFIARLRITSNAGFALARTEAPETADFDFVPYAQRANDTVEDGLHDHFAIFACYFGETGNIFDQISLGHGEFAPLFRYPESPNSLKFQDFAQVGGVVLLWEPPGLKIAEVRLQK